jgi:hypothetical protein
MQRKRRKRKVKTKYSHFIPDNEFYMFQKCRWEFDKWAALGGNPREEKDICDVSCRQIEMLRWERHNFGLQSPITGLMGILEEFGELAAADNAAESYDAVGDILVFTSNMFSKYRLAIGPMLEQLQTSGFTGPPCLKYDDRNYGDKLEVRVGWANHVMLKSQQKIRGYEEPETVRRDICCVIYKLLCRESMSDVLSTDSTLEDIFFHVSSTVLTRDWTKNRETGSE